MAIMSVASGRYLAYSHCWHLKSTNLDGVGEIKSAKEPPSAWKAIKVCVGSKFSRYPFKFFYLSLSFFYFLNPSKGKRTKIRTLSLYRKYAQMDKIDFSIIFNSRDRVPMLTQMLECVRKTTNCIERIEVIVNFDDDDNNSLDAIDGLKKKFKFLKCLVNKREKNIHTNVNKMAMMAEGRYIWALGDDCHIMTNGWDRIALSKFHQSSFICPDNIMLGAVDSTSVDKVLQFGWYCDAPILTREARDGLGYLIHPHYVSAGADVATWIIYSSVGRILDLREILFDHVTHNSIEACNNKDKTQIEYLQRMDMANFNPFARDYSVEIEQIRNLIDAKKNTNSL